MPCLSHIIEEKIFPHLRLDRYVSINLRVLTRSQIKTRNLKAKINGKDVKLSYLVKQGDNLELIWTDSPPVDLIPQDIPLKIIYEDKRCVVVNKAQGMVVHPGAGNRQGTLANALYFRQKNIFKTQGNCYANNDSLRPGIVHRLDKQTSGIIIAAYDEEAHAFLSGQFKSRSVKKYYIAITQGTPSAAQGRIETFIARDPDNRKRFTVSANGKTAVTFYKVIKNWKNYSLVLLRPRTGRTHQLRVHLRHLGNPILGDPVYGHADSLFPQASLMLHSKKLAIILPDETEERIFSTNVPERFTGVMKKLDKVNSNE